MGTKQVLLADAFADEPMGGVPVAVVPGGATDAQLRAVAGELGTDGTVTVDDELRYVARGDGNGFVEAAVAGGTAALDRGLIEAGTHVVRVVDSNGRERVFTGDVHEDRTVELEVATGTVEAAATPTDRLAPALGVDAAAIDEVGRELSPGRADAFGGTLVVPFAFLEGLGGCTPDRETLAGILDEADAVRVCAFTFDTLGRHTDLHVRVFDPRVEGCERATSGVAVAGCGRYLAEAGAVDDGPLRAECGRFLDRPATVVTTLDAQPRVRGTALTVLDGTASLPEPDDDDIVEA